jgi:aminoglycoside phosphotransferase (APT) family kinase protein
MSPTLAERYPSIPANGTVVSCRRIGKMCSMTIPMHEDEIGVDEALVRNLLRSQMPALAELPLVAVEPWGTDNAIWRLDSDLVIRLPRIYWAAGQVDFEAQWLPVLAPDLPVAIPEPIAIGEPSEEYRYRWAVHRWIPGQGAALDRMDDPTTFALALAEVVRMLQAVSTSDAPPAQNRARPLAEYDEETRSLIDRL